MKHRIYLIGLMGSGKTTVGKELAEKLYLPFYDLDELIEMQAGMPITEIFSKRGENEFRLIEQDSLRASFSLNGAIIATGGGTPCFFSNMDEILQNGISFYLKADVDLLCSRLKNEQDKRPLIKDSTNDQLAANLSGLLEKREIFYSKAHHIVDATDPLYDILKILKL